MRHAATIKAEANTHQASSAVDLVDLRHTIRAIEGRSPSLETSNQNPVLSFGCKALDHCLPRGGLKTGSIHDFAITDSNPFGVVGTLTGLIALLAARTTDTPIIWINPRSVGLETGWLYGPGLSAQGLDPDRIMFVRATGRQDALWAAEEAMNSPAQPLVILDFLGMPTNMEPNLTESRRLLLAAEQSGATGFFLTTQHPTLFNRNSIAAESRWCIAAHTSVDTADFMENRSFVGAPTARLTLTRLRESNTYILPIRFDISWPVNQCPYLSPASDKEFINDTALSVRVVSDVRAQSSPDTGSTKRRANAAPLKSQSIFPFKATG